MMQLVVRAALLGTKDLAVTLSDADEVVALFLKPYQQQDETVRIAETHHARLLGDPLAESVG